jgi:hypothetical protein
MFNNLASMQAIFRVRASCFPGSFAAAGGINNDSIHDGLDIRSPASEFLGHLFLIETINVALEDHDSVSAAYNDLCRGKSELASQLVQQLIFDNPVLSFRFAPDIVGIFRFVNCSHQTLLPSRVTIKT